jgi:hypothetical protein
MNRAGGDVAEQALALARIETGIAPAPEDRTRLRAWDRLHALLGVLDSKTSVLLRFNAIIVAALAYVTVVRGVEPLMGSNPAMAMLGALIGHASLVLSALSCGLAFPVINVQWNAASARLEQTAGSGLVLDDAALKRLGALVAWRTQLYSWAWRLAVVGGIGFAALVALALMH